ncbi:MAG TPA: GNAT family N-acetyltransferase [Acidobacteriaceae bacterium]|nr:GNAT family N-acetyltransferase [Acidobacteriaceae bacterium]
MRDAKQSSSPLPSDGSAVVVRLFQPGDQPAFQSLNEAWICRYFALEPKDYEVLGDPEASILQQGGQILLAIADSVPVGCCALIPHGPARFEIGKMAVREDLQGRGIGRKLMDSAIELARSLGANRLYLETNHSLDAALRLYESVGFVHLQGEEHKHSEYSRSDMQMELIL